MTILMWIVCGLLVLSIIAHIALIQVLIVVISRIMTLEIMVGEENDTS